MLLHLSRAVCRELAGMEMVKRLAVLVPGAAMVLGRVGDKGATLAALTER